MTRKCKRDGCESEITGRVRGGKVFCSPECRKVASNDARIGINKSARGITTDWRGWLAEQRQKERRMADRDAVSRYAVKSGMSYAEAERLVLR